MIYKTLLALMLALGVAAPAALDSLPLDNDPIPTCLPCPRD